MQLITGGVLIRWCSLLGAPGAESVLHPVRLHRETINHHNGCETEEREGRKIGEEIKTEGKERQSGNEHHRSTRHERKKERQKTRVERKRGNVALQR